MLKRASTRGWASPGAVEEGFSRGCQLELCIARNTTTWAFRRAKILNLGRFTGYSAVKNNNKLSLSIKRPIETSFNIYCSRIFHDKLTILFVKAQIFVLSVQRIFKDSHRKRYRRSCRICKILRVTISRNQSPDPRLIILITGRAINPPNVIYRPMPITRCNNYSTEDHTWQVNINFLLQNDPSHLLPSSPSLFIILHQINIKSKETSANNYYSP